MLVFGVVGSITCAYDRWKSIVGMIPVTHHTEGSPQALLQTTKLVPETSVQKATWHPNWICIQTSSRILYTPLYRTPWVTRWPQSVLYTGLGWAELQMLGSLFQIVLGTCHSLAISFRLALKSLYRRTAPRYEISTTGKDAPSSRRQL